jgi:TRAP-type C4-dicarboxylate transport system substrate-binding protein
VFHELNYAFPLSLATVNAQAFEALPGELRAAVLDAARQTSARQWRQLVDRQRENYRAMRGNGVKIIAPPPPALLAALRATGREAIVRWARTCGDPAQDILARYRAITALRIGSARLVVPIVKQ